MDVHKLKFTSLQFEILRVLCTRVGNALTQRAIATRLDVSPTAVAKALPLLQKEGFVTVEPSTTGQANKVELNRSTPAVIGYKRVQNLAMLYESGLVTTLEEAFPGATIVLFGSYGRGEDTLKSDIDIAIIGAKPKDVRLSQEKLLERTITLQYYDSVREIHSHLLSNICNGIVLVGAIEL